MYAQVLLANPARSTRKAFSYSIPDHLKDKLQVGQQIIVPFGKRKDVGFVVGFAETAEVEKTRDILEIVSEEPLFDEKQLELAKWIAEYYCCFLMAAVKLVIGTRFENSNIRKSDIQASRISAVEYQISNIVPKLTFYQEKALVEINKAIEKKQADTFLLYGVTGSGKTEVYMRAIAKVLELGRSAIVLVPEIALTPQMVERFTGRFGEQVAVVHSQMTLKQRRVAGDLVAKGEKRIVLGARSALFVPVKDLGIVVIDEEFEGSYKQDKSPRYHAREVAKKMGELHSAILVLGSATPSIETFYETSNRLSLPERINQQPLPEVEIVDMRKEKAGVLSRRLKELLVETFEKKEQAILFLNRRGFFTFLLCQMCGFSFACPTCSVSLAYDHKDKKLRCGHCEYKIDPPRSCPQCNSESLRFFGTGTQRIEQEVSKLLPKARIMRYDRDTVSKRGSHEKLFRIFSDGEADILIGTQMIAKGLDIPSVTLVGAVSADIGLQFPDFRSAETTFHLLTQVAGRAGRHHLPGKVVIQSYTPDHYAIQAAAKHDYESFYNQELKYREELGYPPFSKLITLVISGKNGAKASKIADDLAVFLRNGLGTGDSGLGTRVLGPVPAVLSKIRGDYRYRILLKGKNLPAMRELVCETMEKTVVPTDVRVIIDVEPMGMM
ncbi:primosomal protein N' [Candidatus Saganbacteria bacterium CG08_land_8_20_14_0_20_45_16]|uniref:Replication restart protein PriA n=1 Tax=Candidatus Saganbacteria bacterium CG08_land_8_20_14_0_20_45_16 TaxID=2014293 RepID=A0A2H0XWI7_UNCSA|nr:MAG: primosomal protein N' [Candidatus Saganbacteria bacterium CG08_land_8_20_14_0_20_45_16]